MHSVTIVFVNGNVVNFRAQDLDIDLHQNRGYVNKYTYKNADGEEAFIYLKPNEVAGITLSVAEPGSRQPPVFFRVGGGGAPTQQD